MPLTLDEVERYHRQALLPEWGAAGQEVVRAAAARVAGRGAAALAAARYLAGAGVGRLEVEDPALLEAVRALNPLVEAALASREGPASAVGPAVRVSWATGEAAIEAGPLDGEREAAGAALALEALKAVLGLPWQARVALPAAPPAPAMSHGAAPPPPASAAVELARAQLARARPLVSSVVELIGGTPLVRLRRLEERPGVEIWGKCEFANPGGSVKDRAALRMVREALAAGHLGAGRTLIDSTSGNTGVAYSMIGAALGIPVALVMPANVSAARKQIARAYGTELIFSSELEGSDGAIRLVRELVERHPESYFYPDQYSNEANPAAHYHTTAVEILEAVGDRLTHFVAGIGTSGTVMGTGRRLHEERPGVQVVAVEPDDALHGLEGLKHMATSIKPGIWRPSESVDRILPMPTEEAWEAAERMTRLEGIFVGHSAGASVAAALRLAREVEEGCIVCILPDRGDRYFQPQKWEKKHVW